MRYVEAGYTIALAVTFLYGVGLLLRRRRWERALKVAKDVEEPADPGARS